MTKRAVLLGFVAMGALNALCLIRGAPAIESDIRDRSIHTASMLGIGPTMVHVSGRDVTLRGSEQLDARLRRVGNAIADLPGVRSVSVELDTASVVIDSTRGATNDEIVADIAGLLNTHSGITFEASSAEYTVGARLLWRVVSSR